MQPVFPIRSRFSSGNANSITRRIVGVTLIELIFVVAILAILTALAYPAYLDQVRKARRADAVSSLMAAGQYLERCFTQLNSYNDAGCAAPSGDSADGHYTITVERTATTYTLSAAPASGGSQTSDNCGTFTLDYLGNKSADSSSHRCWGETS